MSPRQTQFPQLTWDEVTEPGCYVSQEGDLYVVPTASIGPVQRKSARSERNPMILTQLSTNPHLSIEQARSLASRAGIEPNF